jgi:RNA polymerase sigma-70 factor (ECF subfamily)
MGTEDRQLLLAAAEGDRSSFGVFVRRHTASLLRFCMGQLADRQAAEDAVQEAMMRLYQQILDRRFPDDAGAWLFAIARRCCQEQRRQRRRHTAICLDEATEPSEPNEFDGAAAEFDLAELVDQLDDSEQALLHMKHTRGLRCREIAEQTGQSIGTVTAKLSRLYARLRRTIAQETSK